MKLITKKTSKKFSPEFGWLKVVEFKFLGFKFWTEHHLIDDIVPTNEKHTSHDLEEMAMYAEWREKLNLGPVDNETFTQILNNRF